MRVLYAYPVSYRTYGNRDFSTSKGFEVQYEQQRTKNIRFTTSYTLAFADGTGSSATSQGALIDAGVPNLRTIMPLSYDVRHTLGGNMDFHYGMGSAYNGPTKFRKALENAGFNLIFRARSGEPYTRQGTARDEASIIPQGTKILAGTINGSRLPWNYKFDIRFDKDFTLKTKKKDEGKTIRALYLNAYFAITNLFNTKNINNVYSYTGNPGDDGYIGSPVAASKVASQNSVQAYTDQYLIKANDPDNYSLPRRIRVGIIFNF
jgi:hypothetical protein